MLFFDLEDYAGTYYSFDGGTNPSVNYEYYQLTQCCNEEPCLIGGKPAVFAFDGTTKGVHPDELFGKVITTIIDENSNEFCGCFKLKEACLEDGVMVIPFHEFFTEIETVDTCEECLPEPEAVEEVLAATPRMIYAEPIYNGLDPEMVEDVMVEFAEVVYKEIMAERYGINFCCPSEFLDAKLDMEILKLDLVTDNSICCP
jgi:hypothetical protein